MQSSISKNTVLVLCTGNSARSFLAEVPPDAVRDAFRLAIDRLERRIQTFLKLPLADMCDAETMSALYAIGASTK